MLAGASGPIAAAFLSREGLIQDTLVSTIGAFMTCSHLLKVAAFTLIGFDFIAWLPLMLMMSLSVISGSWFGVNIRSKVPDFNFKKVFRWVVTFLALRMIVLSVMSI